MLTALMAPLRQQVTEPRNKLNKNQQTKRRVNGLGFGGWGFIGHWSLDINSHVRLLSQYVIITEQYDSITYLLATQA